MSMSILFGLLGLAILVFLAAGIAFLASLAVAAVCSGLRAVIVKKRRERYK